MALAFLLTFPSPGLLPLESPCTKESLGIKDGWGDDTVAVRHPFPTRKVLLLFYQIRGNRNFTITTRDAHRIDIDDDVCQDRRYSKESLDWMEGRGGYLSRNIVSVWFDRRIDIARRRPILSHHPRRVSFFLSFFLSFSSLSLLFLFPPSVLWLRYVPHPVFDYRHRYQFPLFI